MKITIHQPQFMPWTGYFHKMASADLFVFLDDVQFKKNEWQHRNRIRAPMGWQWLSVPNSYHLPQKICEVEILYQEEWRKKHLQSLRACYGKSRFFDVLFPRFEAFYAQEWKTIDRCNIDSTELLADIMGVSTKKVASSSEHFEGTSTQRLVTICRHYGAHTYLAGAGGKEYMDLALFEKAGIAVEFQDFTPPVYAQHWSLAESDFIPGLSAIDLVFNCGTDALNVLMGTTAGSTK